MLINNVELIEQDDIVCYSARKRNGRFEPETFKFLETLTPQGTFVDVGAYTGIYGIRASQLGWRSVFYEPNPVNYLRLQQNLALNNVDDLHSYNIALSDRVGESTLKVNPRVKMTTGGSLNAGVRTNTKEVKVHTGVYDNMSYGDETVIKIDVEGHELNVLKGMRNTLSAQLPTLIVEVLDRAQENEVVAFLKPYGYNSLGMFDSRNLILSV